MNHRIQLDGRTYIPPTAGRFLRACHYGPGWIALGVGVGCLIAGSGVAFSLGLNATVIGGVLAAAFYLLTGWGLSGYAQRRLPRLHSELWGDVTALVEVFDLLPVELRIETEDMVREMVLACCLPDEALSAETREAMAKAISDRGVLVAQLGNVWREREAAFREASRVDPELPDDFHVERLRELLAIFKEQRDDLTRG